MSTITSEIRLRIRAEGDKVLADLGTKLNSLANQATLSSNNFKGLADELKKVQQTTIQSARNIKDYSASWRELASSVDISSKEFKQATAEAAQLDAQLAKLQGTSVRTAAAVQTAMRGPVTGGTAGAGIMGKPAAKLEPYLRLGFETLDPEFHRKRQENAQDKQGNILGQFNQPQFLDYGATDKALGNLQDSLQNVRDIENRSKIERLELQEKYNNLEIQKQDQHAAKVLAKDRQNAEIGGRDFMQRLENREKQQSQRRQRFAGAAQTAGAIAASGVFGGPEGLIGAGIGAFAGPQGALVGGAIGAQVGMARQALGATGEYVAELSKLRIALSGVSKDQADYEKNLGSITRLSNQFLIPLKDTTQQYTKLQASVVGAGMQSKVTETVFRGISAATLATGGTVEDLNASLRATAQVFSKGKVSAEELRQQIGERLPGAFTIFASSIGKTPQELDKALEDGKVTLEDFEKFSKELFRRYGKTAEIIAQAPQNAGARLNLELDKITATIGRFTQPIGAVFQTLGAEMLKGLTPVLEALANIIDAPKQIASERLKQIDRQLKVLKSDLKAAEGLPELGGGVGNVQRAIKTQKRENIKSLEAERLLNTETAKQTGAAVEDTKLQKKLEEDRKVTSAREKALISLRELEQKTINDLADLREKQIQRALDLERKISDQRLKAERDLQDATKQFQDSQQDFQYTTKLGDLRSSGQSTDALKAAKDASDITRDSQKAITQLQRNRDDQTQERERTLENFKKTNAEEVGRIQLNYTRQSSNIIEKAGDSVQKSLQAGTDYFVKGLGAQMKIFARTFIRAKLGLPPEDLTPAPDVVLPQPTQAPRPQVQQFVRKPNDKPNQLANSATAGVGRIIPESATRVAVSPFRRVENASAQLGTTANAANAQQILNERQQALNKFNNQKDEYLKPSVQQTESLKGQVADMQRINELIRGGTLPALAEEYLQIEKSGQKRKEQLEPLRDEITKSETLKGLTGQQLADKDSLLLKINDSIAGVDAEVAATKALVAETQRLKTEKEKIRQTTDQIAESLGSGVGQAIDLLIEGSEDLSASLQNIASNILKDIAKQISQTFVVQPLVSGLKTVLGNLFAGGGVMTEMGPMPLKKYARGGVATGPQMALYGEGSQNEAYVPLPDGRRIPVAMQGSGGGSTSVVVNVDASGSKVEGDSPKGEQLGRALSQAVQQELLKQKRPGGLLS